VNNQTGQDSPLSQQVAQLSKALEFSTWASAGPLPIDRLVSGAFNDSTNTTEAPHATADQPATGGQHGYTSGVATAPASHQATGYGQRNRRRANNGGLLAHTAPIAFYADVNSWSLECLAEQQRL